MGVLNITPDSFSDGGRHFGPEAALAQARRILTEKMEDLHKLAKSLLEYETLSGDEIINVLKGVAPVREEAEAKRPVGPSVAVPISPRPDPEPA